MRKYLEYKNSNELWYKEIPNNWNILRLKDITRNLTSGATPSSGNATYYNDGTINWLNTGDLNDGIIINTVKKLNKDVFKDYPNLKIQKKGTLVIAMYGATIGKLGLLDIDATTNQACCCLNLSKSFNSKYYFYLLLSNKQNIISLSVGGTQPNVSQSILAHIKLIAPPFSEQQAIANYLDAKTQAIDKKISLLEQKIETYKQLKRTLINQTITKGLRSLSEVEMKDSGISWIGQIPQHWEVKRFKDVVKKYTTGGTPSTSNRSYFEGDNVWISIGDIGDTKYISDSSIYLTDEAIKDANIVKTPKGSLLYSFKLSIGKMAFTTKDVYTNEAILSIFPNKNIDLEYYYFMLPTYLELAATENIYGAKMLNQKLIANALVIHPPKSEQEEIAKYLDHKTTTIYAIVGNISKQIETLKQLRKTLINDVVTGKIKVVE